MTALRLDAIPGYVVHGQLATDLVTSTFLASRASDGYPVMLEVRNDPATSLADIELFRGALEALAVVRHPVIPTIREIGDVSAMDKAVDQAFPGSRVEIVNHAGRFEVTLHQRGLLRALGAAELSDGTLRYLLWVAAMLTPRPPELLVLNEPETSLHPQLLPALADLIVTASAGAQVVVVTHSRPLVAALEAIADVHTVELAKEDGQTRVVDQEPLDEPPWHWPKR